MGSHGQVTTPRQFQRLPSLTQKASRSKTGSQAASGSGSWSAAAEPDAERIVLALPEIEQPFASAHRNDQPVLPLDQRLDRVAIFSKLRCSQCRVGKRVVLVDELAGARIVVRFEMDVHIRLACFR